MENYLDKYAWDNFMKSKTETRYMTTLDDERNQLMICISTTPKGWRLEGLARRKDDTLYKEEALLLSHFLGDDITGKRFSKGRYAYRLNRQYATERAVEKALLLLVATANSRMDSDMELYMDNCLERNLHEWNWDSIEKNRYGKFFMHKGLGENDGMLSITYYFNVHKWFVYGINSGEYVHKFLDTFEEMYQILETFDCLGYLKGDAL